MELAGDAVHRATDVLKVAEDKGLSHVEAAGDDVLAVLACQPPRLRRRQALPQALLIVRELHDERALERVLQPLGEHEGDEVAQVEGL